MTNSPRIDTGATHIILTEFCVPLILLSIEHNTIDSLYAAIGALFNILTSLEVEDSLVTVVIIAVLNIDIRHL